MPRSVLRRLWRSPVHLLAAIAAAAMLFAPVSAVAQAATENTLPQGIFLPGGVVQSQTQPIAIITKDSVSGHWCIVGSTATCLLAGAGGGGTVGGALEATQLQVLNELQTPALNLPAEVPTAASDTTYTHGFVAISTATDTTLVSGTSSQTVRLHQIECTIDAADNITFETNTTAISATFRYPAVGGVFTRDFKAHFHLPPSTAGQALELKTTTTAHVDCDFWYRKD